MRIHPGWHLPVLAATIAVGCSCSSQPGDRPDDGTGDGPDPTTGLGVVVEPLGPTGPLTWSATFEIPAEMTAVYDVVATFTSPDHELVVTGPSDAAPWLIKGLRAATTYEATFRMTGPDGAEETVEAGTFTTDELPADFPDVQVYTSRPEAMEPGFTLFLIRPFLTDESSDYFVAVDNEGFVVWYTVLNSGAVIATRFPDDTIVTVKGNPGAAGGPIQRYTLEGELIQLIQGTAGNEAPTGIVCPAPGFHHDVAPNPYDGTWMTLMKEEVQVPNYPTGYDLPIEGAPAKVTADTIFVFDPESPTCEPALRVPVGELLDLTRVGYDSLTLETGTDELYDWGHSNGVWADADGGYVVSLRNQDAVVKVRDGALVWILAPHDNWRDPWAQSLLNPIGPVEWSFHQHSPQLHPDMDGRVLIMDNGYTRVSPFTDDVPLPPEEQYSRAVEYRVDEAAMTVEQTWELDHVGDHVIYSPFVGDADYLPNGNVLTTFGYVTYVDGVNNNDRGYGGHSVRIVEVPYGNPDDVLFDIELTSPATEPGWTTYRAQRVGSLYEATSPVQ